MPDLRRMMKLIEFFGDIYRKNNDPCSTYYNTCKHYARTTELTIKIAGSGYFGIVIILSLSGVFESVIRGVWKQPMIIYFPGIYEYSTIQFALLIAFNVIMIVVCFVTLPVVDMLFFLMFANVPMVPTIIKQHLNSLDEGIENSRFSPREIKHRLVLYHLMHKSYNA